MGSRVHVSVNPYGFHGGRNGAWVGFSWRILPFSPATNFIPPSLHTHLIQIFKACSDAKKRDWGAGGNGKLPHLSIPSKTATLVPEFAVEDLTSSRTAPLVLNLQWRTCPWAEYSEDDDFTQSCILTCHILWVTHSILNRNKTTKSNEIDGSTENIGRWRWIKTVWIDEKF